MAVDNRYDRQERIEHWDQAKMTSAKIAVVGTTPVTNFLLAYYSGLGFGNIRIYSNDRIKIKDPSEFLLFKSKIGDSKAEGLEEAVRNINPLINVSSMHWQMMREYFTDAFSDFRPNLIIDTSNSPRTELVLFQYGKLNGIPVINTGSKRYFGKTCELRFDTNKNLEIPESYLDEDFDGLPQDPITASLSAAIASEQSRKIINPLKPDEVILSNVFLYNLLSRKRFGSFKNDEDRQKYEISLSDLPKKKKVLVVGSGSLGCIVSLLLSQKNIPHTTIDFDTVEDVNFNRQILFGLYKIITGKEVIGENKAYALSTVLNALNRTCKISYIAGKFREDFTFNGSYPDVIFDCVDKSTVRDSMNNYANRNGCILISGGTKHNLGQVITSVPGKTSCLCQQNIKTLAHNENQAEQENGCIHAPQPSVITTNAIIASLMVGELYPIYSGQPINGRISYHTDMSGCLKVEQMIDVCNCYSGGKNGAK